MHSRPNTQDKEAEKGELMRDTGRGGAIRQNWRDRTSAFFATQPMIFASFQEHFTGRNTQGGSKGVSLPVPFVFRPSHFTQAT